MTQHHINRHARVTRAYNSATSEPKGPTYLWARREVTEEEVDEATMQACSKVGRSGIGSVEPVALSPHGTSPGFFDKRFLTVL